MAKQTSTGSSRPPAPARTFGVRLFFDPDSRQLLLRGIAVIAVAAYAALALIQVLTLRGIRLEYDFIWFYQAARDITTGRDPYVYFMANCEASHWCLGGYIYPPLLAVALVPLTVLPAPAAERVWLVLSQAALIASAVLVWRALRGHISGRAVSWLVLATAAFLPLHYTLYFGQVGLVLLLLLTALAVAYLRDAGPGAGAALAVATVLRVSPFVLLLVLLRRRPALVGAVAVGVILVGLLAVLTPYTTEYFTRVLPRLGGATDVLDNQAPAGAVLRAAAYWHLGTPPGSVVTLALFALVLGPTAYVALGRDGDLVWRGAVMAAFVAAMPLVSSITWHHHLVTELLAYATLAPALALPGMRTPQLLAIAAYPLLWVDRHFTDAAALFFGLGDPSGWRVVPFLVVTGANAIGMILLWLAALTALRRVDARAGVHPEPVE